LENNGSLKQKQRCENKIKQKASQKQNVKTKMANNIPKAKYEKRMVSDLWNGVLRLTPYRKIKTYYKRHTVLTHARKKGYDLRYS